MKNAAKWMNLAMVLVPALAMAQQAFQDGVSVNGQYVEDMGLVDMAVDGGQADEGVRERAVAAGQLGGVDPADGSAIADPANLFLVAPQPADLTVPANRKYAFSVDQIQPGANISFQYVGSTVVVDNAFSGGGTMTGALTNESGFVGNGIGLTNLSLVELGRATNFVEKTGGTMTGALVNEVNFVGNGAGLTNLSIAGYRALGPFTGPLGCGVSSINMGDLSQMSDFGQYNLIGGGTGNSIGTSVACAIDGGKNNEIKSSATCSVIGGGESNSVESVEIATIGGGFNNQVVGKGGTIPGGSGNVATGYCFAAGYRAKARNTGAFVWADFQNEDCRDHGINTVTMRAEGGFWFDGGAIHGDGSGLTNVLAGYREIGPFVAPDIIDNAVACIGMGDNARIGDSAQYCNVAGGQSNWIGEICNYSTIAGGQENAITNLVDRSFIGGGERNRCLGSSGAIVGGYSNRIYSARTHCFIGGGQENRALDAYAVVVGGQDNQAAYYAAVVGGRKNNAGSSYCFVGGGVSNSAGGAGYASVAGGIENYASSYGTVGGGRSNMASGAYSFVGGGQANLANADSASTAGGLRNETRGSYAAIPGGAYNSATGAYSFAAGRRAKALHDGTFVWGDGTDADIASTAANQMLFRCNGGAVFTSAVQQVSWTPGGGGWVVTSDKNAKDGFAAVDSRAILDKVAELPITEWNYKGSGQRHVGPMAQDFHAAFRLEGSTETGLNSLDVDGVTLAAIQGLYGVVREQNLVIDDQRKAIAALQERLEAVERKIEGLH